MVDYDFDQPADVKWHPRTCSGKIETWANSRSFGDLKSAVQFVMEKMLPEDRATASIFIDSGILDSAKIEAAYRSLCANR